MLNRLLNIFKAKPAQRNSKQHGRCFTPELLKGMEERAGIESDELKAERIYICRRPIK
jgi:hypothetical protein